MTRQRRKIRRATGAMVASIAMVAAAVAPVGATGHAEMIVAFDEASGQLPEGITVDRRGNTYVSIAPLGQLWRFAPGSTTPETFATIAGIAPPDLGLLGLTVDRRGDVYAGVQSANPAANGVWKFDGKTGDAVRLPGSEAIPLPNDLAFDRRGNLYITDSITGAIWRVPRHGAVEPWLVGDPNLQGTGAVGLGIPIGANGIEHRQGTLYVANTEKALIVGVPIATDGSPGASWVLASFPPEFEVAPGVFLPALPDGLAIDVRGDIYVALINASRVARVDRFGNIDVVAEGDPLDWPSSLAFGTTRDTRTTLFAVNFSIGEGNGDPVIRMGPGVVAIDVGVPGLPLP